MKKFFFKSILLVVLVFIVQSLCPGEVVIPNEITRLDSLMQYGADIIYFGDSTTESFTAEDANKASIGALLQMLIPQAQIAKITHPSYQMDVYAAYGRYILRKGYHPKFVIIPINLRSFSPVWDINPSYQFDKEKIVLDVKDTFVMRYLKPLAVFKIFEPNCSQFSYQYTRVFEGKKYLGLVKDLFTPPSSVSPEDVTLRYLQLCYSYSLNYQHRKVRSLLQLVRTLKTAGIKPIFYIAPLDYITVEKYLGSKFRERHIENVQLLHSLLAQEGVPLLDLSNSLDPEFFIWSTVSTEKGHPSEHLFLKGRMFVAMSLAKKTSMNTFFNLGL
ncbi:MAG: hypothetical protein HQL25_00340 [Candidatus Omnitrophica bacterium]|nr:hypothetical protein [Candidatus Omnitrophota bacterium]